MMWLLVMLLSWALVWDSTSRLYKDGYAHYQVLEWLLGLGMALWALWGLTLPF